jgi:hypothetical protein
MAWLTPVEWESSTPLASAGDGSSVGWSHCRAFRLSVMSTSEEQNLTALLAASRNRDGEAVTSIWREMTPGEQEGVVLALLGMQTDLTSAGITVDPEERAGLLSDRLGEGAPVPVESGRTELIPKSVADLRGLTGFETDEVGGSPVDEVPAQDFGSYRTRWIQRWKRSALASALAVTILFAFTGDVSSFGPKEWAVAIVATVAGGGLLVGTLVNFAVAAISAPGSHSAAGNGKPSRQ